MEHKEGEGKEASTDELDVRDITLADLGLSEPPVMTDFQEIMFQRNRETSPSSSCAAYLRGVPWNYGQHSF